MSFKSSMVFNAVAIALLSSNYSLAQSTENDDIETITITVTGDYRDQNVQTMASSLSVIDESDIAIRNAQNLEEIVLATPNVNFSSGSNRARYYQIRGIGERSQFQEPINPSVGIIIDEVDFTGIGSVSSMFDIAQVEVFRGPQGTKFGANALAGVINMVSKQPTEEFEGQVRAMAGNYDSWSLGAVFSGPATDKLGYRIAVEQYESDGFVDNTFLDVDDTNNRDELTARSKFVYQASTDLSIDVALFYFDFDNGYDTFSLDNTRETLSDQPGFDTQETYAGSVKATYSGSNTADVITIFSHADSDMGYGYDEDWSNPTLCQQNECIYGDYSSTDHYFRDKTTSTAELRFVSGTEGGIFANSTQWVTGLYTRFDEHDLLRQYTYAASDFDSNYETTTYAAFLQLDSKLSDKLTLTSGIRVEQWELDYSDSEQLSYDDDDTMVGGKLVLGYQASSETLYYASVNRGFKAGGINTDGTLSEQQRRFDPEYLWNYELGLKTNFLDNSAYLRAAVFYMDRDDMQVKTYEELKRPDGTSEFLIYLDNAASGVNQGVELDAGWQVTQALELYAAIGYLDTEYKDFINGNGEDFSGREQAHAPNYQFNLGVNYFIGDDWLANINVDGKDEFFFSDSHDDKSDAVELVNASLTYFASNWSVKLWGRNLTDEDYQTRGFYFGNDPRDGYTAKGYYQYGAPKEYGVTFDYSF
ncbi:TonB-dependent receptor [Thalassotalea sp. Y01]|uniref:TonB-dependent receptor n=1 Tax=Thalassotalea sp. Y01 TaxID=2729613 RepID=UPI00145E7BDC|nr:TonB-dependent receptor [Thalassotalea sp. Y01]NMP15277.1 TonB-dependent receptor [Thalassotalea sp. Y01]